MTDCRTCELLQHRDDGAAPAWDAVLRTEAWDVVHSYNTCIAGWMVLILRRHVTSLAELTEDEAAELGPLVRRLSIALQEVTGCPKTYVAQFAEHPLHPHVHVHVIPRSADLTEDEVGPGIFRRLGVAEADRVSEHDMNQIALALRATTVLSGL